MQVSIDSKVFRDRFARLLRMQGSDPGFFVLSVHSFIEAWLRDFYQDERRTTYLSDLLYQYREEIKTKAGGSRPAFKVLDEIMHAHDLTNAVRHGFKAVFVEEARVAAQRLGRFCALVGMPPAKELDQIAASNKLWEERSSRLEDIQRMHALSAELDHFRKVESSLSRQLVDYQAIKSERDRLSADRGALELELQKERESKRSKDAKYDEVRQKAAALQQTIRNLDGQLDELTQARDYALDLTRMTLYTRTRIEFEKELARLTPDQQRILDEIDLGDDFLIKGGAGTGKTLILLKALEKHLAGTCEPGSVAQSSGNYVFITYSDTLVKYDRYIASIIQVDDRQERIRSANEFILARFKLLMPEARIDQAAFEDLVAHAACGCKIPVAEIMAELEGFIFANDVTESEYSSIGLSVPV